MALLLAMGLGLLAAGCGAKRPPADAIRGRILTVYSSLPLLGPSATGAQAVLAGERRALGEAGGHVGRYRIVLKALNDATVQRGDWDPGQTTINAHVAQQDPTTIGYLGDFNSGATAVAIPVLGRVGIPEISPTSTAVGLTSQGAGASPGEPAKYYPTGRRNFVALAPNDAIQAAAEVRVQRRLACRRTFVLNDGPFDGYDAAVSFELVAHAFGLDVVANQEYDPRATDYTSLALSVAQSGANCVLVSALPGDHAVPLVERLVATMPHVLVFAIGALAQPSFTSPEAGGLATTVDPQVIVTAPGADESRPDGIVLPSSYVAYGYESMRLLLGAISRATAGGRDPARRSHVLADLFGAAVAGGPLGNFVVRSDGSTTLTRCAIYRLSAGRMALWYDDVAGVR